MNKPRVLLFTETYYPVVGGGETQAKSLAEGFVGRGIPVTILTRRSHPDFKKVERYGSVMVHRLPPTGPQHLKKWGLILTSVLQLIRLRKKYNIIFVSGFRIIGIPTVILSKLLGKVCILKADSPGEMSGDFFEVGLAKSGISSSSLPFRLFLTVRNALFKRADAFVAISTEIAEEFIASGVGAGKIHNIPNSVDTNRFHPVCRREQKRLRIQLGLPEDGHIIIYTGRLVSYKGLPLLLRVWKEIQEAHLDAYLLIVGSGGLDIENCEEDLKKFVLENKLQERVFFTGAVENVQEYLQAADIFVFPTEKEAFGISVIEAMACGLAVIATRVGGLKDIIQPGKNGLLIQAQNRDELRSAIDQLIDKPERRQSLGTVAINSTMEQYTQEFVANMSLELFTKMLRLKGFA